MLRRIREIYIGGEIVGFCAPCSPQNIGHLEDSCFFFFTYFVHFGLSMSSTTHKTFVMLIITKINDRVILKIENNISNIQFPSLYQHIFQVLRPTFCSCHRSTDIKTVIQRMAMKGLNNYFDCHFGCV